MMSNVTVVQVPLLTRIWVWVVLILKGLATVTLFLLGAAISIFFTLVLPILIVVWLWEKFSGN